MRRLLLSLSVLLVLAPSAHASWVWPVQGDVITQYRNGDDPYAAGQHRGIDIAAPVGAPVVATAGGDVLFAGTAGSSGLTVSVRTGDGFDTSYLHLSAIAVRAGAHVSAGERLGAVGTSGTRSADQPHLHFGVRGAGTRHGYVDPLSMLPPAVAPPVGEGPREAPAPVPAPLAPVPAPAPAPRRMPRPAPVPRRGPAPIERPAPRERPALVPSPLLAPRPAPASRPAPAPLRSPRAAQLRARPAAALGSPGPAPAPLGARRPAPAPDRARPSPPSSGPDVGWALACAGLLLAAGVLGLTDDGRRAAARGRSRVGDALRPLLGRR